MASGQFYSLRETGVPTSQEELMALVLPSHKEGDLYIKGVKISVAQLAKGKKEMIPSCTLPSSLVVDFVDATEIPGRALDLGCGIGANSVVLLNKRWDVIAVDKSPVAVQGCLKTCEGALGSLLSIQADIATMDLPGSMDLIVAVDVLPYMSETEVPSLLSKIHAALHPGGRFIGTLFVCLDGETREISIGRGLGAHYYHGDRAPAALLQHAGFHIERCSLRYDYDDRAEVPKCVEFVATR